MSVEVIKEQIYQFLASEGSEVMAIKGEWSIGNADKWVK